MGAIPCDNPAHNGEAHTGCLAQGEAIDGGQCRGKPSAEDNFSVWPRND